MGSTSPSFAPAHLPGSEVAASSAVSPLLEVNNLRVRIPHPSGEIHAVRDVSLRVEPGERVAILGESGCGKTMTALAILGLQPARAQVSGTLGFQGAMVDLAATGEVERLIRPRTGIVFQDSLSSLNPIARIGTQLTETLRLRGWKAARAHDEAVRVLAHVGMPDPAARMQSYPHELSGGMRQRVMISMALLAKPALLIADEPTTALDTTVQAQVIDLIRSVQAENAMGLLLITHDLAMAAELCDRAIIMYAGFVVEDLPMRKLLDSPAHPYARALLAAMPRLDTPRAARLPTIEGELPSVRGTFTGCPFAGRCAFRDAQCMLTVPAMEQLASRHGVRCVHPRLDAAKSAVAPEPLA